MSLGFDITDGDFQFQSPPGLRTHQSVRGISKSLADVLAGDDNTTFNTLMPGLVGSGCFTTNTASSVQFAPDGHVIVGMDVDPTTSYSATVRFKFAPVTQFLLIDGGSSDACGVSSTFASPSSFSCSDIGTNQVTLFVNDNNGNSSQCTASVTVEDTLPPVAVCQDITIQLDPLGLVSINPTDVDGRHHNEP